MNTVTPAQRSLARWLLQQDVTPEDGRAVAESAARAWDKLSPRLAHIFTVAGSRGLAKRAIFLAQRDFPLLRGAQGEFGLDGLSSAIGELDKSEAEQVAEAVLANIIALTVTFIGEDLSLRAMRDVWPDASLRDEDQPQEATL